MGDEDVRTFLAIARHGNIAEAARSVGVAESAFVARVEALCDGRGARMLARTSSGYALTKAGKSTLAHFEWIKDEVLAAERSLST